MRKIYQLLKLRFLTPYSLLLLYRAKRKHGNNLCFLLKFAADYYGDNPAITDEMNRVTFKQLYSKVLALSTVIQEKIHPEGNHTAILICNNSVDHIITLYALQNTGITLILVNDKTPSNDIHRIIENQAKKCIVFGCAGSFDNVIDVQELISEMVVEDAPQYFSKKPARIIFPTSGTTGEIKLIQKRTGEFYWLTSFADLINRTNIDKGNSAYIAVPFSHGFGYTALLFTLVLGKKIVVANSKKTLAISNLLSREKVDTLVGVPTSLYRIAEHLQGVESPVRSIISGGAALNEIVFSKLANLTSHVFSIYGSTEASTSFVADYAQLSRNVRALGTPLKGVKYKLQSLPGGATELLIQSPLSNSGTQSEWISTGDLVENTSNGDIVWCSRKDDMIIKMGVNIYPVAIEKELLQLDCVEDAYVTGEADSIKGQNIVAFVKERDGFLFDEKAVMEKLRLVLSGIKIPDKIEVVGEFPYTSTGKKIKPKDPGCHIQRNQLRDPVVNENL